MLWRADAFASMIVRDSIPFPVIHNPVIDFSCPILGAQLFLADNRWPA